MERIAAGALLIAFLLLLAPNTGRAEFFVDLRAGYAFTDHGDTDVSVPGLGSVTFVSAFDDSPTGGGRVGYWLGFFPWVGLAADVSYFGPDITSGGPDIDVIPVTPLLMARVPIAKSEDYPYGRVHPFVGIGPGIFISEFDDHSGYDDVTVDVGLDLHAGLEVLLAPWLGIFAQYRYTSFEAQYSDTTNVLGAPGRIDTDVDLDSHHVAGGLALHF